MIIWGAWNIHISLLAVAEPNKTWDAFWHRLEKHILSYKTTSKLTLSLLLLIKCLLMLWKEWIRTPLFFMWAVVIICKFSCQSLRTALELTQYPLILTLKSQYYPLAISALRTWLLINLQRFLCYCLTFSVFGSLFLKHLKEEMRLGYLAKELISIDRLSPDSWYILLRIFINNMLFQLRSVKPTFSITQALTTNRK